MKLIRSLSLFALVLAVAPLAGQPISLVPDFTGERLYTVGVPNVFGPVKDEIQRLEKQSAQTYYVVVIKWAGPGSRAVADYLDNLHSRWVAQAAQKGLKFDRDRAVLVLLAADNRKIMVHAGDVLRNQYGLTGPTLDRELVQRYFVPFAKEAAARNDPARYAEGLKVLLREIDQWVKAKDTAWRQQQQQAAERAAQLKKDAEASLAAAASLEKDVQQELAARKQAGLLVQKLENQVREAGKRLAEARQALAANPAAAQQQARQATQVLHQVQTDLGQLLVRQEEAAAKLNEAGPLLAKVEQEADRQHQAGLAVVPVRKELDDARQELLSARTLVQSEPERALQQGTQLLERLRQVGRRLEQLPDVARQMKEAQERSATLLRTVGPAFQAAAESGAAVSDLEQELEQARGQVQQGHQLADTDYAAALAQYQAAVKTLEGLPDRLAAREQEHADRIAAAERQHVFRTRTLPMMIVGSILAVAVAVGCWLRYRLVRARFLTAQRFGGYKDRTMNLRERLDALKERHKDLPVSDKDFTEPMVGETLACYNQVQEDSRKLWDAWLEKMEVWEKVQRLVRQQTYFNAAPMQEAERLMKAAENFDDIERVYQSCVDRLDRLNNAHEHAEELTKEVEKQHHRFPKQLDAVRAAGLSTRPYEPELEKCTGLVAKAKQVFRADPLTAQAALTSARDQMTALGQRVQRVLEQKEAADKARGTLDEAVARVADARGKKGLRLALPDANPDPYLDQARSRQQAAAQALDRGQADEAAQLVQQSLELCGQAVGLVKRVEEARAACREQVPARRAETQRVRQAAARAQGYHAELERSFAPESWKPVAGNLQRARELLDVFDPRVAEAEAAASDATQDYFHAAAVLAQVQKDQAEAHALLKPVGECLESLVQAQHDCEQRRRDLAALAQKVQKELAANDRLAGAQARSFLELAERKRNDAAAAMTQARPNWPAVRTQFEAARRDYEAALSQIDEDVRTYRKLTAKLDDVRREAERVGDWLRRHREDRPRANQRFHAGNDLLERVRRESEGARGDWVRLLQQVEEADRLLKQAYELAQEDLRLAQQAEAELAEAEREVARANGYSFLGITANVRAAEELLARAMRLMGEQAYEQVIDQANAAERAARDAHDDAVRQAQLKQQRLDHERRQQEMAAAALMAQAVQAAATAQASRQHTAASETSWSDGAASSTSVSRESSETSW